MRQAGSSPCRWQVAPWMFPATGNLIVFSSETRNAAPREAARRAARRVTELLRVTKAWPGELLFKKIDSTLRGPIGAELQVLLTAFPGRRILLCPANPFTGRTVRGGVLHVQGVPLHLTEFRNDPLAPVTTGDLVQLREGREFRRRAILKRMTRRCECVTPRLWTRCAGWWRRRTRTPRRRSW